MGIIEGIKMRNHPKRIFCFIIVCTLIVCQLVFFHYSVMRYPETEQQSSLQINPSSRRLSVLPEFLENKALHKMWNNSTSKHPQNRNDSLVPTFHSHTRDRTLSNSNDDKQIYANTMYNINTDNNVDNLGLLSTISRKFQQVSTETSHDDAEMEFNPGHMSHAARYKFNCSNIDKIKIKHKLGHGVTKQVYLGIFGDEQVAVKMVTRNVIDVTSCLKSMHREDEDHAGHTDPNQTEGDKRKCFVFPNMKLMKEILIMEQVYHPNLMKMLGYCVRNEETESTSLQEHGVIAVYEYGMRFYVNSLSTWSLRNRLKAALELTSLLYYLQYSPLGSLRVSDFKDNHFLLINNRIKLIDMDDLTSLEPSCTIPQSYPSAKWDYMERGQPAPNMLTYVPDVKRMCHFGLSCQGGICLGHNAKYNLDTMNRVLFKHLLVLEHNLDIDTQILSSIVSLQHDLDRLKVSAKQIIIRLRKLLNHPELPL